MIFERQTRSPRRRRVGRSLAIAMCWLMGAAAVSTLGGCQLFFAAVEMMFPYTTVQPQFELPKAKTVLVFPDDVENPVSYPPIKRKLAEHIAKILIDKSLVARTIPYDKLIDLRSAEPNFNRMAVASVGRKLGADVVVYISINEYTLKNMPIETLWRGKFAGWVRVVDVNEGRLWPVEQAGHSVSVNTPTTENVSETYGEELSAELAEKLATEVAGLFHEHKIDRHKPPRKSDPFEP